MLMELIHRALAAANLSPFTGVSGNPNDPKNIRIDFTPEATAEQKAAARAFLDSLDVTTLRPENLELFYELFAKDALTGVFTPEQWATMKMLADVKTDISFRNQVLLQVASAGTEPQRVRLAQIAAQCGIDLPTMG